MTRLFYAGESLNEWYPEGNVEAGVSLVNTPIYRGSHAFKCERKQSGTPATMINWDHKWHTNLSEAYAGFALYVPASYQSPEWTVVHEFCQETPFRRNLVVYLNHDNYFNGLALQFVTWAPDDTFKLLYRCPVPRDQWIVVEEYLRLSHTDGKLIVYINGDAVYASPNMDLQFERPEICSFMVGVYGDKSNPDQVPTLTSA